MHKKNSVGFRIFEQESNVIVILKYDELIKTTFILGCTQHPHGLHGPTYFDYFGVYHNNALYYLPLNFEYPVIRHELHQNIHRTIPNSNIPNVHDPRGSIVHGLRVGKYFWIFGGVVKNSNPSISPFSAQYHTSLWHIKKESWISGPKLPEIIAEYPNFVCATALNSTTVVFFSKLSLSLITYNLQKDAWKDLPEGVPPWKLNPRTCSIIQDKQNRM